MPPYALVVGNPARIVGWWSEAGEKMEFNDEGIFISKRTRIKYRLANEIVVEIK